MRLNPPFFAVDFWEGTAVVRGSKVIATQEEADAYYAESEAIQRRYESDGYYTAYQTLSIQTGLLEDDGGIL